MINTDYKQSELTGKIIGCAMKVHTQLGNGFQEVIYQRSLDIEMRKQGLDHHLAQAINYLEAYKLEIGLLINFGAKSLEFKRITNEKKLSR
jgi:hypothetical protein